MQLQQIYLTALIIGLLLLAYHFFTKSSFSHRGLLEGLENGASDAKTCESDTKTMLYKNSGSIQYLQTTVEDLMKKVNKLILNDDAQQSQASELKDLSNKYQTLDKKASQLAEENKKIVAMMASQSKNKMNAAQSESDKINFDE